VVLGSWSGQCIKDGDEALGSQPFQRSTLVNIQDYKQRLLALEAELSGRTKRETSLGRGETADSSRDIGDASVADEEASVDFTEAELDSTVLEQVRDALARIDAGTFGTCVVDGGPIEPKRLEAIPWTPYCLKHQALLEAAARRRMPTL
jgi:DnaK suppressor protein